MISDVQPSQSAVLNFEVSPKFTRSILAGKGDELMEEQLELVELELRPVPPHDLAEMQRKKISVKRLIEDALRDAGNLDLLEKGEIQIEKEKTFPTDQAIIIALTLCSSIALETFKAIILPELKKRFKVRKMTKRKK